MDSADEELELDKIPASEDWLAELKSAVSTGVLSEDGMHAIGINRELLGVEGECKARRTFLGRKEYPQ